MAYNLLSSDSTTPWLANTAGDTYVLKEGVYLGVLGTAISATAFALNRKFQIDGHVTAEGGGSGMFIGVDAFNGGSTTIAVSATGSVFGEAYGIVSHGGDLLLTNQGAIVGTTAGLYMDGFDNKVFNQGNLLSIDGVGISVQGIDNYIENSGTITGKTDGVLLADQDAMLVNSGAISSSDDTDTSAAVHLGDYSQVVNSGSITNLNGIALLGNDGVNYVTNSGEVDGVVILGGGDDYFFNDQGAVYGDILLGDGSDVFVSAGGFFSGSISGGDGNDSYEIDTSGINIIESVDAGQDSVSAGVSYTLKANFEDLTLTGVADLKGEGNASTNIITGNVGNNRLLGRGGDDFISGGAGADVLIGGAGTDRAYYYFSDAAVRVDLSTGKGQGGEAQGDLLSGIEDLSGSVLADRLTGNSGKNRLDGIYGNDRLTGAGGRDEFVFSSKSGSTNRDTIVDFADGQDRIDLTGWALFDIDTFAEVKARMTAKHGDVVIDFSAATAANILTIKHAHIADFSAADFLLG